MFILRGGEVRGKHRDDLMVIDIKWELYHYSTRDTNTQTFTPPQRYHITRCHHYFKEPIHHYGPVCIASSLFSLLPSYTCCSLRGPELFDVMVDRRVIPEQEARGLIRKIIKAVAYLHSENIVHRDIKVYSSPPSSLFVIPLFSLALTPTYILSLSLKMSNFNTTAQTQTWRYWILVLQDI